MYAFSQLIVPVVVVAVLGGVSVSLIRFQYHGYAMSTGDAEIARTDFRHALIGLAITLAVLVSGAFLLAGRVPAERTGLAASVTMYHVMVLLSILMGLGLTLILGTYFRNVRDRLALGSEDAFNQVVVSAAERGGELAEALGEPEEATIELGAAQCKYCLYFRHLAVEAVLADRCVVRVVVMDRGVRRLHVLSEAPDEFAMHWEAQDRESVWRIEFPEKPADGDEIVVEGAQITSVTGTAADRVRKGISRTEGLQALET